MTAVKNVRDVNADYKAAYIYEYEACKRGGKDDDAATVAEILRTAYGHEVEPAPEPEPAVETATAKTEEPRQKRPYNKRQPHERADLKPAPEKAVEPKPEHPSED